MTEAELFDLARDVFGTLFVDPTVEVIEQAGHRCLKVTVPGVGIATLWIRPGDDQSFEVRALGATQLALRNQKIAERALADATTQLVIAERKLAEIEAR